MSVFAFATTVSYNDKLHIIEGEGLRNPSLRDSRPKAHMNYNNFQLFKSFFM